MKLATLSFLCFSIIGFGQSFTRSELNTNLSTPWEITFGFDNYLWITEFGGTISRINPDTGIKQIVYVASDYFGGSILEDSPDCTGRHIGYGTLGLDLHPDFLNPDNSYIYFVYSYNSGTEMLPVTKFKIRRLKWDATTETVIGNVDIVNDISNGFDHLGGRLMCIEQNGIPYLFLTIGDHGVSEDNSPNCYVPQTNNPNNFTQDISTWNGKIHRFNIDGSIPIDNPIAGNPYFTRGHRNPQGLMYNPNLDIIYSIEHGDRTDDEINILYKGMNYGWKDIRGYKNDNSHVGEANYASSYIPNPLIPNDSLVDPIYSWCTTPSISSIYSDWCTVAPSDGIYYNSTAIPEWTNSLLVVTLKDGLTTDREVFQFKLDQNGKILPSTLENPNPVKFFGQDQSLNGRLRDIAYSKDGRKIYLINNGGTSSDKIIVYTYSPLSENLLSINIFPNPSNTEITLSGINHTYDVNSIEIYNLLGEKVKNSFDQNFKMNVSLLANGVFFIKLPLKDDVVTLKFIKY